MLSPRKKKIKIFWKDFTHPATTKYQLFSIISQISATKFEIVNIHYNTHLNVFITTPNNSIDTNISSMFQG